MPPKENASQIADRLLEIRQYVEQHVEIAVTLRGHGVADLDHHHVLQEREHLGHGREDRIVGRAEDRLALGQQAAQHQDHVGMVETLEKRFLCASVPSRASGSDSCLGQTKVEN